MVKGFTGGREIEKPKASYLLMEDSICEMVIYILKAVWSRWNKI